MNYLMPLRHRLFLLGALATASIWVGAFFQYLQLKQQTTELVVVRNNLQFAEYYANVARFTGHERGLSNGMLLSGESAASLIAARQHLDTGIAKLIGSDKDGTQIHDPMPVAVADRLVQLGQLRSKIDRHDISAAEAFAFYTDLIGTINDSSAQRLAEGMVAIKMQYEYVNWLQHTSEMLAQLRGLCYGIIATGHDPDNTDAIAQKLVLLQDALHNLQRTIPADIRGRLDSTLNSVPVHDMTDRLQRFTLTKHIDTLARDRAGWWTLATQGVDAIQNAAQGETMALSQSANIRINELEWHLRLTVASLIILGILTLGLVLSTVGRLVHGLNDILQGLGQVAKLGNFRMRLDESRRDEFGTISIGINHLIEIAGAAVEKQELLSLTDPLTGLLNRRGLDQQLSTRTIAARTYQIPLSLVMIDIDHFKSINDTLGHACGDIVLRSLGKLLHTSLRPDDVIGRYGGEEFLALLPGCPLDEAINVAEKLRATIAQHNFGIEKPVTASLGVALWHIGQTPEALVIEADLRLYEAKNAGRDRVMPIQFIETCD